MRYHNRMSEKESTHVIPDLAPGEKPEFMQPSAHTAPYPGSPNPHNIPITHDHELDDLLCGPPAPPPTRAEQITPKPSPPLVPSEIMPDVLPTLRVKYMEIARLAAMALTSAQIAKRLGYKSETITQILKHPNVEAEIGRYRAKLYDQDLITAMKDLGGDSMAVIVEMLHSPSEKLKDRAELAKWIMEKLTGKAKQEVNVESNTLAAFMDLVKTMKSRGESIESQTIDVTPEVQQDLPSLGTSQSKHSRWLDENLE